MVGGDEAVNTGEGSGRDPSVAALWIVVAATAAVCVVLAIPRPVTPRSLPPLLLDAGEVTRVMARDAQLAAKRPRSGLADRVWDNYLEEGRAAADGVADQMETKRRRARASSLARELAKRVGDDGLSAWRSYAVEMFDRARMGKLSPEESVGVMGRFDDILNTYAFVRDGIQLAPDISVRSAYKVRWNIIHKQDTQAGLANVEVQAFEGWIALQAGSTVPVSRRRQAVRRYAKANGPNAREAEAALLFLTGNKEAALAAYRGLFDATGSVRFRNHAMAALMGN